MNVIRQIAKARMGISRGLATQHPAKLVAGLALGAVLLTGMALHFTPNYTDEGTTAVSRDQVQSVSGNKDQQRVAARQEETPERNPSTAKFHVDRVDPKLLQDVAEFFGEDVVAALGYEVLIARLNQYQGDRPLSSREIERLDYEIDMMLVEAAQNPAIDKPLADQQIERLERQINLRLSDAARDHSNNMAQVNREIERLDYQIDMTLLAAMQDQ